MGRGRTVLNQAEGRISALGRTMAKLVAKRRTKQDELGAIEKDIADANRELLGLLAGTPPAPPPPVQEA